MKAHEVRALLADPVARARLLIEDEIRNAVLTEKNPTRVHVGLSLSDDELAQLKRDLYADGFSVAVPEEYLRTLYDITVIWHEKARTVRGPLASNTISDTGPVQPNGDRQ